MSDIRTIANMLKEIQASYPNWKADEDTVKVWTVYLQDMDNDLLVTAVRKFISSSDHAFPPSIPEIRGEAAEIRRQVIGIPSAYEAWQDLQAAGSGTKKRILPGNVIETIEYRFLHPLVKAVSVQLGWPDRFPGSLDQEMADRSHFIKAYDATLRQAIEAETQLPAVTGYIEGARQQMKALSEGMSK